VARTPGVRQDAAVSKGPHELAFVLDVPAEGVVEARLERFDLYRPAAATGPLPAVVFVHGPVPAAAPARPRDWPVYQGYGRLAAAGGLVGLPLDLDYPSLAAWPAAADQLGGLVEVVRARPEVDADRVALWAFSGGGLLVGRWLADSPGWLGCLALSYPLLHPWQPPGAPSGEVLRQGRPIVLTRVGRERPEVQATVDGFLASAAAGGVAVEVVDVPEGRHGFDALDHAPWAGQAVTAAMGAVSRHLLGEE
jgi:acetyl esterase/lipase